MPRPDSAFFEPWSAEPARTESADWIVWGSAMIDPCVVETPGGTPVVMDGRRIVTRIGTIVTDRVDGAAAGRLARRIASCVNACAALKDPERAIAEAQALLADLGRGVAVDPWRVARCCALVCPEPDPRETLETLPCREVTM